MKDLANLDGSFGSTFKRAADMKDLPPMLQKFMVGGVFQSQLGFSKQFDEDSMDAVGGVEALAAQLTKLDKSQRNAFYSMSTLNDGLKEEVERLIAATQAGERFNSKSFEDIVSATDVSKPFLSSLMNAGNLKDINGNYLLSDSKTSIALMEDYINHCKNAAEVEKLLNAEIIEQTENGYQLSSSILELIGVKNTEIGVTNLATSAQKAWTVAVQLGKQALLSLGVAAVVFIATKIVDYIKNLKTHSEELVDTMNSSHDAAEQAKQEVEDIQSKIDELNNSLEKAGAKEISDIVDPTERERLQAINDMLQAQLELKKQLEKDTNNKVNEDTSAVVNDKTEKSITKFHEEKTTYAESGSTNTGVKQVADDITKTESLQEHSQALNEAVEKRRELETEMAKLEAAGQKESQEYKDKQKELDSTNKTIDEEKTKINELSTAVSEQMDSYSTNADNFDQYKDEYVAGTNAMTEATKALANAQDDTKVDTTNVDVLKQKIEDLQEKIANGSISRGQYKAFSAVDVLKNSGVTTGDDILNLASDRNNQTKSQATAINILREAAKAAGVTLREYVSVLEQTGEVAVKAATKTRGLSNVMTMLDDMQSGYQACSKAVTEYNKKGYVTMDTLQSLINLEPRYMSMLEMKNGKLKINGKTAQTLTDTYIELARAELLTDTLTKIKETTSLEKAQEILGEVKAVVGDADKQIMSTQHQAAVESFKKDGMAGYDASMRATKQLWDNYKLQDELLQKLGKQKPSDIWGDDKTSKSTKQASSAIDAWSTLTSAMEEYNKQGSISYNTMKSLMGLEEKYTKCLRVQGDQMVIDTATFRDMIEVELAALTAQKDKTDTTTATIAQYNQIIKYLDQNARSGAISLNELRDAIEGVGTSLDYAQEKTSGLKSAFGTIHDILNDDNPSGALTSDNVEAVVDLIQEHSELKDILYDESGNLQVNEERLKAATIQLLENEKAATKDAAIQAVLQKSINDLGSLGNILYHLTPVEDWNLSLQYAKKAAEGEGIWDKLENGAKAIYYGCGLGRHIDNLIKLVKKIFKIQDDEAKDNDSETTTKDVSSNKNLSVNGTETTTTTKKKMLSDPDSSSISDEKQGPSTVQWVVNPVGSGVDTLTGYDYNNKENNSLGQNIAHAVTHPIETAWNAAGTVVDWVFGKKKKKHATSLKSAKGSYLANVDERGSELMVRNPAAGRYTYLETGDGVVPADITSRLFEMGGNPDAWFDKQMAKYGAASNIQSRNTDNRTISVGDIHVNNPVGNADDLARELVQRLPSAIDQRMNKR